MPANTPQEAYKIMTAVEEKFIKKNFQRRFVIILRQNSLQNKLYLFLCLNLNFNFFIKTQNLDFELGSPLRASPTRRPREPSDPFEFNADKNMNMVPEIEQQRTERVRCREWPRCSYGSQCKLKKI